MSQFWSKFVLRICGIEKMWLKDETTKFCAEKVLFLRAKSLIGKRKIAWLKIESRVLVDLLLQGKKHHYQIMCRSPQCGNFRILLSTRFCVKMLADFETIDHWFDVRLSDKKKFGNLHTVPKKEDFKINFLYFLWK